MLLFFSIVALFYCSIVFANNLSLLVIIKIIYNM